MYSVSYARQSLSTSASKLPTAARMERYSPGDTPLLTRSMYWYLMRRSLNQRSAFFVSKDLLFPKI